MTRPSFGVHTEPIQNPQVLCERANAPKETPLAALSPGARVRTSLSAMPKGLRGFLGLGAMLITLAIGVSACSSVDLVGDPQYPGPVVAQGQTPAGTLRPQPVMIYAPDQPINPIADPNQQQAGASSTEQTPAYYIRPDGRLVPSPSLRRPGAASPPANMQVLQGPDHQHSAAVTGLAFPFELSPRTSSSYNRSGEQLRWPPWDPLPVPPSKQNLSYQPMTPPALPPLRLLHYRPSGQQPLPYR